jgi:hypothetical protein
MTDRELLELAAKAAGIPGMPIEIDSVHWLKLTSDGGTDGFWKPLTDDGDALRLAVKLRISLHIRDQTYTQLEESAVWIPEGLDFPEDRCAATRRAIVRAAAEIGKAMK